MWHRDVINLLERPDLNLSVKLPHHGVVAEHLWPHDLQDCVTLRGVIVCLTIHLSADPGLCALYLILKTLESPAPTL